MTCVAVVVVTYNGVHCIDACLRSIVDAVDDAGDVDVWTVVVDNCSSDDTLDRVRDHARGRPARTVVIASDRNEGFGVGNNRGLSWCLAQSVDHVMLLNQDAMLQRTTIRDMVRFMEAQPHFGACSPLHMSPTWDRVDARTYQGYLRDKAMDYVQDCMVGTVRDHYAIDGVNAAVWLLRRQTIETVGGFDPLFFMYTEDDDYLSRMKYHRLRFALLPGVRVLHLRESPHAPPPSGFVDAVRRLRRRRRSRMLLLAKDTRYGDVQALLQLLVRGILTPAAEWLIERNHQALCANVLAAFDALTQFRRVRASRRLLRTPGPHFLTPSATDAAARKG
jgi:GT2 family glycosyltransferase